MNLTELQMQLRSVEEQMAELQTEIEKMKPKPESEKKLIYNKITKLAQKYPVENKRSFNISEAVAKAYVSCLAHIIVADEYKIYDKLLYLTRIAYGMGSPLGNATPPFPQGQGRAHQRNESVHIERMKNGFLIYTEALEYLDGEI